MVNSAARRCSVSAWWRASRAFGDEGVYFLVAGVELIVKGQLALGAVGQVFDEGDDLADVAVEGTQAACIGVGTGQLGNDGEPVVAFSGDHHVVGLHLSHPFPSAGSKSFSRCPYCLDAPYCAGCDVVAGVLWHDGLHRGAVGADDPVQAV